MIKLSGTTESRFLWAGATVLAGATVYALHPGIFPKEPDLGNLGEWAGAAATVYAALRVKDGVKQVIEKTVPQSSVNNTRVSIVRVIGGLNLLVETPGQDREVKVHDPSGVLDHEHTDSAYVIKKTLPQYMFGRYFWGVNFRLADPPPSGELHLKIKVDGVTYNVKVPTTEVKGLGEQLSLPLW